MSGQVNKYRLKPTVIDAIQITELNTDEIESWANCRIEPCKIPGPGRGITDGVKITTLGEVVYGPWGHYLAKSATGALSIVRPFQLGDAYEELTDRNPRP